MSKRLNPSIRARTLNVSGIGVGVAVGSTLALLHPVNKDTANNKPDMCCISLLLFIILILSVPAPALNGRAQRPRKFRGQVEPVLGSHREHLLVV